VYTTSRFFFVLFFIIAVADKPRGRSWKWPDIAVACGTLKSHGPLGMAMVHGPGSGLPVVGGALLSTGAALCGGNRISLGPRAGVKIHCTSTIGGRNA